MDKCASYFPTPGTNFPFYIMSSATVVLFCLLNYEFYKLFFNNLSNASLALYVTEEGELSFTKLATFFSNSDSLFIKC